jgi:hypothetical protein
MTTYRHGNASATLLQNGQVLEAGGIGGANGTYLASAELYNPATAKWTATGSMTTVRSEGAFTATLLQNGEVLIAGGKTPSSSSALASAELYNPATGTFSETGSMSEAREGDTATLLPDGEVLIAGGWNGAGTGLVSAELYNPATGTFSPTGSMPNGGGPATLLQNGEVLVGDELYNPATGTWTATGTGGGSQTVLLANGDVLAVSGGGRTDLYNPKTGTWSLSGTFDDRNGFSVTLLGTGKVLVAGGLSYSPRPTHTTASALLYDPATGKWTATGSLNSSRYEQKAVLLQSGQVLVAGGNQIDNPKSVGLTSAELYQP